jgi:bifunctional lysine-specific demethylase and histidyl-hydroxylase NO66
LKPISLNEFFKEYFQRKPMVALRPSFPQYYGPLVDLGDVHYAIENGYKFTQPELSAKYGEDWKLAKRILKNGTWWTGVFENPNPATVLTADIAFYAVSQGYTLIFNRAQSISPNIFQASWQLEEALGWLVNTNLYLTASGGAQGFEAHIDWMDGFIFQTTGTKRWKTYDPPFVLYPRPDMTIRPTQEFLSHRQTKGPLETEAIDNSALYPPPNDFILRAGDLAYIPRGFVHEACTSPEDIPPNLSPNLADLHPYEMPSLHLTFGMEVGRDYTVEVDQDPLLSIHT